ncbi:hypothetical protein F5Y04DRAFT_288160 [Hypomontagnella monticulosa]|nr:hypothetical protein F5Y04DRAFT_288160 [Hypomontagnella monticulosa]
MPASHRPDIELWKNRFDLDHPPDMDLFKFPLMNIEDLSKTEPFLLLLNSRARLEPCNFAYSDLLSTSFGLKADYIVPDYLEGHFMIFRDRSTPETYGQLYRIDEPGDAAEDPTRCWFAAGEGLWIMKIQDRLYKFLVKCCEKILHDIAPELLVPSDDELELNGPSLTMSSSVNSEGIKNLAIASFEELYKGTARTDFDHVASIVKAMQASAEDHLWSLRENPGYLSMHVKTAKDHSIECMPDLEGQRHPLFVQNKQDIFWGRMFGQVISNAMRDVDLFGVLNDKIIFLSRFMKWYEDAIDVDQDLPQLFGKALFQVQYFAICGSGFIAHDLQFQKTVFGSPPLRMNYRRVVPDPEEYVKVHIQPQIPEHADKVRDDVEHILEIMSDEKMHFCLANTGIVDELELLAQRQPAAKAFVSASVAEQISVLGTLYECTKHCQHFQPWIIGYEQYLLHHAGELKDSFDREFKHVQNIGKLDDQFWSYLAKIIMDRPSGSFEYPTREQRDKNSVEIMRKTEDIADEFWTETIKYMRRLAAVSPRVDKVLARDLKRTEPWIAPIITLPQSDSSEKGEGKGKAKENPKAKAKGKGKAKAKGEDAVLPSFDQLILEARAENEAILQKQKKSQEEQIDRVKITVDKRALKVFHATFYDENELYQQGDVAWKDFIHAMKAAGFSIEKLFGSAWHFKPSDPKTKETIILHEPFMAGKLSFAVLQHYRRRLSRIYGWDRNTFALAT